MVPEKHLNLIPGLVRLVFHDCSGKNCDGCINKTHPFNGRVVPVVEALEPLFNDKKGLGICIKDIMSRADFWALGSIEATKIGIQLNNRRCRATGKKDCLTRPMKLPFRFGRKDCSSSPFYTRKETPALPPAFLDNKQTLDFFKINFGFNSKETTTIMGGHSLGFSGNNTRIPGTWEVGNADGFGNQYFKNILNKKLNWRQVPNIGTDGSVRWRWVGDNDAFGLQTDINLVRDITVDPVTGFSSSYLCSPKSSTLKYVKKLTKPRIFAQSYAKTFIKMITLGPCNLMRPKFTWFSRISNVP
uniref:Ascorbate peroxidase n=1 Tax=Caligus clemensi TaxID=344056 RepID=C1BZY3_CALCM|nr:ascorbate peroxidase precursor [Caligus clemensi]